MVVLTPIYPAAMVDQAVADMAISMRPATVVLTVQMPLVDTIREKVKVPLPESLAILRQGYTLVAEEEVLANSIMEPEAQAVAEMVATIMLIQPLALPIQEAVVAVAHLALKVALLVALA